MKTIVEFRNVAKAYGMGEHRLLAVDGISFTIDEGEFVVILGPSGAGKIHPAEPSGRHGFRHRR